MAEVEKSKCTWTKPWHGIWQDGWAACMGRGRGKQLGGGWLVGCHLLIMERKEDRRWRAWQLRGACETRRIKPGVRGRGVRFTAHIWAHSWGEAVERVMRKRKKWGQIRRNPGVWGSVRQRLPEESSSAPTRMWRPLVALKRASQNKSG